MNEQVIQILLIQAIALKIAIVVYALLRREKETVIITNLSDASEAEVLYRRALASGEREFFSGARRRSMSEGMSPVFFNNKKETSNRGEGSNLIDLDEKRRQRQLKNKNKK